MRSCLYNFWNMMISGKYSGQAFIIIRCILFLLMRKVNYGMVKKEGKWTYDTYKLECISVKKSKNYRGF